MVFNKEMRKYVYIYIYFYVIVYEDFKLITSIKKSGNFCMYLLKNLIQHSRKSMHNFKLLD